MDSVRSRDEGIPNQSAGFCFPRIHYRRIDIVPSTIRRSSWDGSLSKRRRGIIQPTQTRLRLRPRLPFISVISEYRFHMVLLEFRGIRKLACNNAAWHVCASLDRADQRPPLLLLLLQVQEAKRIYKYICAAATFRDKIFDHWTTKVISNLRNIHRLKTRAIRS